MVTTDNGSKSKCHFLNKSKRVQEIQSCTSNEHQKEISPSYTINTRKESICLELVKRFRDALLSTSYDDANCQIINKKHRRKLLRLQLAPLFAKNEYGVEKFVCTTVRPTLLPYTRLYDYAAAASFLAHFLQYEPLEDPTSPPDTLPSPTQVLEWCTGDCFDFAMVLASILLGAGYDAFVVYGFAPKWVCERDQAVLECPKVVEGHALHIEEPTTVDGRDGGGAKLIDNDQTGEKDDLSASDCDRVHSWVLVRAGKRGMKEIIFLEPSTGEFFPVDSSPYHFVLSVWNAKNFWIAERYEKPRNLSFDLDNKESWRAVFSTTATYSDSQDAEDNSKELINGIENGIAQKFGDVPDTWVNQLIIRQDLYQKRYPPNGQRVILYNKAKLELYSEGVSNQGLLTRLTTFFDKEHTEMAECHEFFVSTRRDKLYERIRNPKNMKYTERFRPNNRLALREWIEEAGQRRFIYFYPNVRRDGLCCHEEHFNNMTVSRFQGRFDKLKCRIVYFTLTADNNTRQTSSLFPLLDKNQSFPSIAKVIEQFEESSLTTTQDITKRIYLLQQNEIKTEYYNLGKVTKKTSVHRMDHLRDVVTQLDQDAPDDFVDVVNVQKRCLSAVRMLQEELVEIARLQKRENERVQLDDKCDSGNKDITCSGTLTKTCFRGGNDELMLEENTSAHLSCCNHLSKGDDTGRNEKNNTLNEEKKPERLFQKSEIREDILSPYLQHVKDPCNISKEEAVLIRDSCLKTLKDRLLERANIMQNRLNQENTKLSKHQADYQQEEEGIICCNANERHGCDREVTEEQFEKICSEATFRIKILEQRLIQHEETALAKYKALEKKIVSDPRMNALTQK